MKNKKQYLIGATLVVEMDCLPLVSMIFSCSTSDVAMLRWIAYIKSMNPKFKHISRKNKALANMLSWARYDNEESIIDDEEDVDTNLYSASFTRREGLCLATLLELFSKKLYDGEWLHLGKYLSTLKRRDH